MIITKIRHKWPNPPGYCLNRVNGHQDYSFVHFTSGVKMLSDGKELDVPEHTCIIYRPQTPQFFYCYEGMIHDWFHFKGVSDDFFRVFGHSA